MTTLSQNMVATAKEFFTGDILSQAAIYLDESETSVYMAVTAAIPVVFSGLLLKAAAPGGAAVVHELATELADNKLTKNITTLTGNGTADIMRDTTLIITRVFDKYPASMIRAIAQYSGVRAYPAAVMLSIVTPVVLSVVGKYISARKISRPGIKGLLQSQRINIELAIPPGINTGFIFSNSENIMGTPEKSRHPNNKLILKIAAAVLMLALAGIAAVACFHHDFSETDKKDIRGKINLDSSVNR